MSAWAKRTKIPTMYTRRGSEPVLPTVHPRPPMPRRSTGPQPQRITIVNILNPAGNEARKQRRRWMKRFLLFLALLTASTLFEYTFLESWAQSLSDSAQLKVVVIAIVWSFTALTLMYTVLWPQLRVALRDIDGDDSVDLEAGDRRAHSGRQD